MFDSDNKLDSGYELALSKWVSFDTTAEAKSGDDWWLSPDEEDKIREQLIQEGRGGFEADRIVGQINTARFKQYKGEEPKHEMALMNPTSGGWFR